MSNPLPMGGQEFGKRTPPTPHHTGAQKQSGVCALSIVLAFAGVASIIVGLVCSIGGDTAGFLYVVVGILVGLHYFALAVIVEACYQYIKSCKN